MPYQVTVNNITGSSPYNLYLCDDPITTCVYMATITSGDLPNFTFVVPDVMSSMSSYTLKVTDNAGCITTQILTP